MTHTILIGDKDISEDMINGNINVQSFVVLFSVLWQTAEQVKSNRIHTCQWGIS